MPHYFRTQENPNARHRETRSEGDRRSFAAAAAKGRPLRPPMISASRVPRGGCEHLDLEPNALNVSHVAKLMGEAGIEQHAADEYPKAVNGTDTRGRLVPLVWKPAMPMPASTSSSPMPRGDRLQQGRGRDRNRIRLSRRGVTSSQVTERPQCTVQLSRDGRGKPKRLLVPRPANPHKEP